jgi:hypothetical protein
MAQATANIPSYPSPLASPTIDRIAGCSLKLGGIDDISVDACANVANKISIMILVTSADILR